MGLVKNVTAYFFGGSTRPALKIETWNITHLFFQYTHYLRSYARTMRWMPKQVCGMCGCAVCTFLYRQLNIFHAYIIMTWLCDNIKHVYSVLNRNTGINYFIARIKIRICLYSVFFVVIFLGYQLQETCKHKFSLSVYFSCILFWKKGKDGPLVWLVWSEQGDWERFLLST